MENTERPGLYIICLLTKPVAVVDHLPGVFIIQFRVGNFQWVEFRYMVSPDLFFSSQQPHLVREKLADRQYISLYEYYIISIVY